MAGRASTLTRSLMQRCKRLISSAECSSDACTLGCRRSCWSRIGSPVAKLAQKFLRRDKERILLKNAADDDHWMRPHDVNHRVSANFREVVSADHRVFVAKPHLIHPRFELNQVINLRS